jgi:2'-5' RNA ligase
MEMPAENSVRLFFALWPDAAERGTLAAWQQPLLDCCGGRAMRPDTLHATLIFLGEIAEHRLEALHLAAQEVHCRSFPFDLVAAHYWGHNHIVYAAPESMPPPLVTLVKDLEQGLRRHHFDFDVRPYKAHVTLLRNAQWSDATLPPMPGVTWQINDFVLVRSLRSGQGGYEVLARFSASDLE